mmetsp:Transcript_5446/g.17193  ORF Transcript_5446/g.17193 Transcript_5446/m.17193 type:complete len:250 (-) Transcript_5446:665-1414(-)
MLPLSRCSQLCYSWLVLQRSSHRSRRRAHRSRRRAHRCASIALESFARQSSRWSDSSARCPSPRSPTGSTAASSRTPWTRRSPRERSRTRRALRRCGCSWRHATTRASGRAATTRASRCASTRRPQRPSRRAKSRRSARSPRARRSASCWARWTIRRAASSAPRRPWTRRSSRRGSPTCGAIRREKAGRGSSIGGRGPRRLRASARPWVRRTRSTRRRRDRSAAGCSEIAVRAARPGPSNKERSTRARC